MRKFYATVFCIIFTFININAQSKGCHATESLHQHLAEYPEMQDEMNAIEVMTAAYTQNVKAEKNNARIVIPVVVHILYRTAIENISEAQVLSQLQALNRDFARQNTDFVKVPSMFTGVAADIELDFQLARRDENGNATNGIMRYPTTRVSWNATDDMKKPARGGVAPWNPAKYLNIWVCSLGGDVVGFASFPGAPAEVDGVVIDFKAFGTLGTARAPFNQGRTCVHEIGHWLNLQHIWGDSDCGDDKISDTPQQSAPNYGCPAFPHYSTCNGKKTVDMTMNYMDYANDECMLMFTAGQKLRMHATLNTVRQSILSSDGHIAPQTSNCANVTNVRFQNITTEAATITWNTTAAAEGFVVEYKAGFLNNWTILTAKTNTVNIQNLLPAVSYEVRIKSTCNGAAYSNIVSFKTQMIVAGSMLDAYENNNTRSVAKKIGANTNIVAYIGEKGDNDWFSFTTTTAATNVRISLTDLPKDFDVKLYDANGNLVAKSENNDLSDENLVFDANYAATYFVRVYGYNGNFDSKTAYSLNIQTSSNKGQKTENQAFATKGAGQDARLSIYPNPVENETNISIEEIETEGKATVEILDLGGKVVFTQSFQASKMTPSVYLDLSHLTSGFYVASVNINGERLSKKLIKN